MSGKKETFTCHGCCSVFKELNIVSHGGGGGGLLQCDLPFLAVELLQMKTADALSEDVTSKNSVTGQ